MVKIKPIIYIVLSVYNWENYFLEQLMSIYYQNYNNRYLIIVDDWSTDSSYKIAEDFVNNYNLHNKTKIIKQENQWTCKAIERWLIEVQKINKWDNLVALCDADDIWTRDKLEIQVKYMQEHEDCDLCFHDLVVIDENNNLESTSFIKRTLRTWDPNSNSFFELATGNHITTTEIVFRTKYISDIIPIQNEWAKDYRTVLNFALNNKKIDFIDKVLWYYRRWHVSIQQKLRNNWALKITKRDLNLFKLLWEKYADNADIKYFISYYTSKLNWCEKWYSRIHYRLLILLNYPKIFFHIFKNTIKNFIIWIYRQ